MKNCSILISFIFLFFTVFISPLKTMGNQERPIIATIENKSKHNIFISYYSFNTDKENQENIDTEITVNPGKIQESALPVPKLKKQKTFKEGDPPLAYSDLESAPLQIKTLRKITRKGSTFFQEALFTIFLGSCTACNYKFSENCIWVEKQVKGIATLFKPLIHQEVKPNALLFLKINESGVPILYFFD